MSKTRLEAFSDGVIAILITILVLELHAPEGGDVSDLLPALPSFLGYILSFVYLAIYWNNHHHLLQGSQKVNGKVLWANIHLLFWLSLVPFTTGWMGEHPGAAWPAALYGIILFLAAVAYYFLSQALIALHGRGSLLGKAIGNDFKGKISLVIYLFGILIAFTVPWLSYMLYSLVAVLWLIPDRRIENVLRAAQSQEGE